MSRWRALCRVGLPGLVVVLLLVVVPVRGDDGDFGQPGGFPQYGVSVRSAALGRAFTGLADDASGIFYNPAGMMRLHRQTDFYIMGYEPTYDNTYIAAAAVWCRPQLVSSGFGRYLLGDNSSIGLGFVSLGADGFDNYSADDQYLGEFDINDWALYLGYARRWTRPEFILDYGFSGKFIGEGITDLDLPGYTTDHSFGVDLGVQMQLIHPPLLKKLGLCKLRHLLPLRIGATLRNFIQPQTGLGGESEKHPKAWRVGISWESPIGDQFGLLVIGDLENQLGSERRSTYHAGAEFRVHRRETVVAFRSGLFSHRDDVRGTVGLGVRHEIAGVDLRFDFAQELSTERYDQRFSLAARMGADRLGGFFTGLAKDSTRVRNRRDHYLEALANWMYEKRPAASGDPHWAGGAARILMDTLHTDESDRYAEFLGGLHEAELRYREAVEEERRRDTINDAVKARAVKAVQEYEKALAEGNTLDDDHRLNYARVLMMADRWDDAHALMAAASLRRGDAHQRWRLWYQRGVCSHRLNDPTGAAAEFDSAMTCAETVTETHLAAYERGLIELSDPQAVQATPATFFGVVAAAPAPWLEPTYPRFRTFNDLCAADDAWYRLGEYYEARARVQSSTDDIREQLLTSLEAYSAVCRMFPGSDSCTKYGDKLNQKIEALIDEIEALR